MASQNLQPPYELTLRDPSLLASVTKGLADQDFYPKESHKKRRCPKYFSRLKYEAAILDGVAFLLKSHEDIARDTVIATGMMQRTKSVELYWAKDDRSASSERIGRYINDFLQQLRTMTSPKQILSYLVQNGCKPKILARCKKLAKAFSDEIHDACNENNILGLEAGAPRYEVFQSELRAGGLIDAERSLTEVVDNFLRGLSSLNERSSNHKCMQILIYAHALASYKSTIESFVTKEQFYHLQKLARYAKICTAIRHGSVTLGFTGAVPTGTISVHQVPLPPTEPLEIPRCITPSLNKWAAIYPSEDAEVSNQACQQGSKSDENLQLVKATHHPELIIALHLISLQRIRHDFRDGDCRGAYIVGTSKAPCRWCVSYIHTLNFHLAKISKMNVWLTQSDSRNIREDPWVLPPTLSGLGAVNKEILRKIGDAVQAAVSNMRFEESQPELWNLWEVGVGEVAKGEDEGFLSDIQMVLK